MTHQMHYTSCADGVEGLRGFQVRAVSDGAPWPVVELAAKHCVYELGLELSASDPPDRLPVVFGYVVSSAGWTVFRSRYLGADYTGRLGNYLAHAVLEGGPFPAADALPVDVCTTDLWHDRPAEGTVLSRLDDVRLTPVPDAAVAAFLAARPGRLDQLAALVGAVQTALTLDRTVVLVTDPDEALLWLTAATRSLPRAAALCTTFVSYAPRPRNVVISCTAPSAATAHSDAVVDVSTPRRRRVPDGPWHAGTGPVTGQLPSTAYAAVLRRSWDSGWTRVVVAVADTASPPVEPADLDIVAAVIDPRLLDSADEATLLRTARLAMTIPRAQPWSAVAARLDAIGGITDLAGWAPVLPRSSTVASRYADAVLALPAPADLPPQVVRVLGARLAALPDKTVWDLHPDIAEQVASMGEAPARTLRHVEVTLARHRRVSRVQTTRRVSAEEPAALAAAGAVLWADPPDPPEIDEALSLTDDELRESGLAAHFLDQVMAVRKERVSPRLVAMAARAASALPHGLGTDHRRVLEAFEHLGVLAGRAPMNRQAASHIGPALAVAVALLDLDRPDLAQRLWTAVETRLRTVTEVAAAAKATDSALAENQLDAYRLAAVNALADAGPQTITATFGAWAAMERGRVRDLLLHQTLPEALHGRDLDKIPATGEWDGWRAQHERRSLATRLLRRRLS